MRDFLFEGDANTVADTCSLAKKFCGPHDQIVIPGRQRRIVAGKIDPIVVPRPFDDQPVRERDRRHEGFNFVETVGAASFDLERKIDLRRRRKLHILQFAQQISQKNRMKSQAAEKIIVALDAPSAKEGLRLVSLLSDAVGFFKIGLQSYTAEGPELVRQASSVSKIFLDLKLHDIPNTVAKAVEAADKLGVKMLTLHLSGGSEMIRAAGAARKRDKLLLGVTVSTSTP